ncbi:MAG: dTMP kinase [Arenicellales bacterium]|jgi:dTMP kinase|nr:dTMP kinase [Arenicellales bacterium]MDP6289197.1 dTMP kinase [Arenicellales bacterium]MDP7283948.1 dTMP kinase [Arenicellales bacterium]MDP7481472.1 dTMP kinase [Arenicellales bacterium]MDP7522687.1 dTMP kinase [Arenicellales bacterium]|tara:strand:- start:1415 stop:2053 length:639 start_codon:yes stop_codon:yes gene_type:complete
MKKGMFITVEGSDGAGKTTQLNLLVDYLRSEGIEFITTREPGGTDAGELLREIVLKRTDIELSAEAEALMVFASRSQHLSQLILPTLNSGKWVISDRFTDATYAYQGGGRGIGDSKIEILEEWVQKGVKPDLTLLFDVPLEIGIDRTMSEGGDRFEDEKQEFKQLVREQYLKRARAEPQRIKIIETTASKEHAHNEVRALLKPILDQWKNGR